MDSYMSYPNVSGVTREKKRYEVRFEGELTVEAIDDVISALGAQAVILSVQSKGQGNE